MTHVHSEAEAFRIVSDFEATEDMLRFEIDNQSVWPVLRFGVMVALTRGFGQPSGSENRAASKPISLVQALGEIGRLTQLPRRSYLVKTFSSELREPVGGSYKNIWFDDLMDRIGPGVKLEHNNLRDEDRNRVALQPADGFTNSLERAAKIASRLIPNAGSRALAKSISAKIQRHLRIDRYDPQWVDRTLRYHYALTRAWSFLLQRQDFRFVVIADPGEHSLCSAAHKLRLPVLELQHGAINAFHPSYVWTSYAKPYRSRMPIPSRLLLFGEHWRQNVDRFGFWGGDARVVGSPHFDWYRSKRRPRTNGSLKVIFTSQGIDIPRAATMLESFSETALSSGVAIDIAVKTHPTRDNGAVEWKSALRSDTRIRILGDDDPRPTIELIAECDLHMSISSTCHFEALGLGIRTAVLPLDTATAVKDLVASGDLVSVANANDFVDLLMSASRTSAECKAERFYRSNALDNIEEELKIYLSPSSLT